MLVVERRVTGEEILDLSRDMRWWEGGLTEGRCCPGWRLVRVRPTAIVVEAMGEKEEEGEEGGGSK